jgi:heptosyltransferase-3
MWKGDNKPNVVVLTERPDYFSNFPIDVLEITSSLKDAWTVGGRYHFRIKNRGLRYITEQYPDMDKLLFLDTDTYFTEDTSHIFDEIDADKALLFYPEENIYEASGKNEYCKLHNQNFKLPNGEGYKLSPDSVMWNSGVIGLDSNMFEQIDYADDIILVFMETDCKAHTIEQFALSEALRRNYTLVAAKNWVNHYSTSGRKDYARGVLVDFFKEHGHRSFDEQIKAAGKISFRRTLSAVIRGHIYKKKTKLKALLKKL